LNYYVYYKVPPERLAEIAVAVQLLFQAVLQHSNVSGRWMRRRDDPTTFMEVYEGVDDEAGFEELLKREGGALLSLPRKVERFISVETPA
jgi:Domain of unknown function (DUF4936)